MGKEQSVEQSTKNTAPHSIQQVAGILVSREKPLCQNASRQIKSLPSRQLPKQQARQTKSFPLQFADKDRQRNETSLRSSMPKRSAPRQSRKALIQQVSEQPVREENCLFSIPTGSSQPRWLANQHISGQPYTKIDSGCYWRTRGASHNKNEVEPNSAAKLQDSPKFIDPRDCGKQKERWFLLTKSLENRWQNRDWLRLGN